MKSVYRNLDYSIYNNNHYNYCYICYDTQYYSFMGALYGKRGLGFYYPGFETVGNSKFPTNSNDAVSRLSAHMRMSLRRGHIINAELDGSAIVRNLVPLSYTENSRHKISEAKVKRMVHHLPRLGNDKIYVVGYEVVVKADQNGIPTQLALEANIYYLSYYGELVLAPNKQRLSEHLSGDGTWIGLPVTDSFDPLL